MAMITDVEVYFTKGCGRCDRFDTADCSTKLWAEGLAELRRICTALGLEETVKWAHPCYRHAERNIALINAFRGYFCLTYMNAALLRDPEGVLLPAGPNAATPSLIRFTGAEQVRAQEPIIRAYLEEAMGYAVAGIKPPKETIELDLPDELVEALDSDAELAEAFADLTPGRQKSYVINLNGARQSATRVRRIEMFRPKILAGKGAQER